MASSHSDFIVKDSGQRVEFSSGMRRDTQEGKDDFLLIRKLNVIPRMARHLTLGAKKYGNDNWALARTRAEQRRFKASAARHFEQWLDGEMDEDHAAAVVFNMFAHDYVKERIDAKRRA